MCPKVFCLLLIYSISLFPKSCYCVDANCEWKCPNDETCLSYYDVCAVPLKNKIDCPHGGDQGDHVCNSTTCAQLGRYKCPNDPYCVGSHSDDWQQACFDCPSGGRNKKECTNYCKRRKEAKDPVKSCSLPSNNEAKCFTFKDSNKFGKAAACDGKNDCQNGKDEKYLCDGDENCALKTGGTRIFHCPNSTVCMPAPRDNLCKCPNGPGTDLLCTKEMCRQLKLSDAEMEEFGSNANYIKCPGIDSKCIGKWKLCDGKKDCPSGGDEDGCTNEKCETIGKEKCPKIDLVETKEAKCVFSQYFCDGDEGTKNTYGGAELRDSLYSTYIENKCPNNGDESEILCKEKCKKEGKMACPYVKGKYKLDRFCIDADLQMCFINDDVANTSILTKDYDDDDANSYLWRCSPSRTQWIEKSRTCDDKFDCLLREDESETLCDGGLNWMQIHLVGLLVVVLIMGVKIQTVRKKLFPPKIQCGLCLENFRMINDPDIWLKKRQFLGLLLQKKCDEWKFASNGSIKDLEETYKSLHDNFDTIDMKDVHFFLRRRVNAAFSFSIMYEIMEWRHKSVYGRIFDIEMKLHGGNLTETLKCIQKNLGTSAESYAILDYKEPPTIITKITVFIVTSLRYLEFHIILSPFLRAFLFVMDIIKDYLLVQLLAQYIFDFGKDRTTDEDYYLFAVSIFSLMIGHISILCVTVPNRYESILNILCMRIGKNTNSGLLS